MLDSKCALDNCDHCWTNLPINKGLASEPDHENDSDRPAAVVRWIRMGSLIRCGHARASLARGARAGSTLAGPESRVADMRLLSLACGCFQSGPIRSCRLRSRPRYCAPGSQRLLARLAAQCAYPVRGKPGGS